MNRSGCFVLLFTLTGLVGGCLPEKRIVWSPDGSRAAVATPNGLYLIDATGKILPPRLTGTPARCCWLPDGKHLAVVHASKAEKWSEVEPLFDQAQRKALDEQARNVHERALAYTDDWDDFKIDPDERFSSGEEAAILLCVRDRHADKLKEKLGEKWTDIEKMNAAVWKLSLFRVDENSLKEEKNVYRGLDELYAPAVSGNGKIVSFLRNIARRDEGNLALYVVPADGSAAAREVAQTVSVGYDWSPDSRGLVFIRGTMDAPDVNGTIDLGSLTTILVSDQNGKLLGSWAERTDRVGVLFSPMLGASWLRDGRLVFSSVEVTLPATSRDMPQGWTLFVLDPRMPASVTRVLGRDYSESVEPGNGLFEISPDETQVLLPGPEGRVSRYEFASGNTQALVENFVLKKGGQSRPSWRNSNEVCFVGPEPAEGKESAMPQVWLWKAGKATCLSTNWPKEMREGWLTD